MKQPTVAEFAYAAYLKRTGETPPDLSYNDMLATVSEEMIERGDLLADFVMLEIGGVVGSRRITDVDAVQDAIVLMQRARDELWAVEKTLYAQKEKLLSPAAH